MHSLSQLPLSKLCLAGVRGKTLPVPGLADGMARWI
jgi:hypothetical protein